VLRKNRAAAATMLCSLWGSACQDLTTGSAANARLSRAPAGVDAPGSIQKSLYICNTSDLHRNARHRYTYTRASLRFPKNELAADGGTQEFRLRVRVPGQPAVAAANCRIPNTRAAAERMYRTFERIFANRAKLDPLGFRAREEERRAYLNKQGNQAGPLSGPRFSDVPIDGVTVTAQPVNEGGATGWTGMTDWGGWGSQGDGVVNTGSGDAPDPAPAPAQDGPVLALIVCLGGLLGAGLTIDDVADQAKQLIADKDAKEQNERTFEMYVEQPADLQDQAERDLLYNLREQSIAKYNDDVHQLAVKLKVSDYVMFMAIIGCAASLAAPTP
jgi:hypothetical protein